jgi:hypothetical protein
MAEKLAFQDERFKMREDVRVLLASTRLTANRTSFQKKEQIMHQFERLMVRVPRRTQVHQGSCPKLNKLAGAIRTTPLRGAATQEMPRSTSL